jgi:hypothetical protein
VLTPPPTPPTGNMTLPDAVAYWAIIALPLCGGSFIAAGALLAKMCGWFNFPVPANPPNFVQFWKGRLTPEGKLDRHGRWAGRSREISPQDVERVYQGLINWKADGRDRPYESKEDAEANCPALIEVRKYTTVSFETIVRRIKEEHPKFHWTKLRIRWQMKPKDKQKRGTTCQELLSEYRGKLHRVVFVDQKCVHMWEEDVWGYVDLEVGYSFEGIKPARYQNRVIKVKYYGAVNSRLGAFYIRFYTGTSGMPYDRDGHNYRVRSGLKEHWLKPSCNMR